MLEQRREHYRVHYPSGLSPSLMISGRSYDVVDISEKGLKFKATDIDNFYLGCGIAGDIKFYEDDELIECYGEVLRLTDDEVVVSLTDTIPVSRIKVENLFLTYHLKLNLINQEQISKQRRFS